jgi:hypothetical protein
VSSLTVTLDVVEQMVEQIMVLTVLEIKHAKFGVHPDGNGLYLSVKSGGTKSWVCPPSAFNRQIGCIK